MKIFRNHNGSSTLEPLSTIVNDINECTEPWAYELNCYDLSVFSTPEQMKKHWGDIWDRWFNNHRNILLIDICLEVPAGEPQKFYRVLIDFCRKYGVSGSRVVVLIGNNYSISESAQYIHAELPDVTVVSINFLEWDAVYQASSIKVTDLNYPRRRFLIMSRCYKPWRHYFMGRLYLEKLLQSFYYSFYHCNPYPAGDYYDKQLLFDRLRGIYPNIIHPTFEEDLKNSGFYDHLPFRLPNEDNASPDKLTRIHDDNIYSLYKSTDIDIVVETIFSSRNMAFHPTEKIWKSIYHRKPWVVFSSPYFLRNLRECGYKTFDPWIDESYDNITDNHRRVEALVAEIKRLDTMPQEKIDNLVKQCSEVCEHNYRRLEKRLNDFYHGCVVNPTIKEILNVKFETTNQH